jgi:4-diphosphocytidyl-2-C-methyl-D-erythritol kinase
MWWRGAVWPTLSTPPAPRRGRFATVVTLTAPAKVTLSLRVVGVRADGYHLIDAEMVSVDLYDTIDVTEHGDPGRPTVVEVADAGMGRTSGIPLGPDNLVAAALELAGRQATVRLHKAIPPGAGLGGGSSDAAAVLRWAGVVDPQRTVVIGADVPFCVVGGRARVSGVGEVVESLDHVDGVLTLATPPFGCPTPAVYAAWDRLGGPVADGPNDLEAAALEVEPRLAQWRDHLGMATGTQPVLAGSGSTWFVPGAHPGPGRQVVRMVPAGWAAPENDQ